MDKQSKPIFFKKVAIVVILLGLIFLVLNEMKFLQQEDERLEELEKVYGIEIEKPSTEK